MLDMEVVVILEQKLESDYHTPHCDSFIVKFGPQVVQMGKAQDALEARMEEERKSAMEVKSARWQNQL